ncbi:MAG: hypothetical protein JXR70_12470 [Spirochaetales bacterium]|nr:hypothetical protein [Spirochaetales bacterium]
MKIRNNKLLIVTVLLISSLFLLQSCGGCLPKNVNVNTGGASGSLSVTVNNIPRPSSGTNYVSIVIAGNLVSNGHGQGRTSFSETKTFEVSKTAVNPAPTISKTGIKPGNWKITVSSDAWNAAGTGSIEENSSRSFIFSYNSSNVSVQ